MFSQACLILSVHRVDYAWWGGRAWGMCCSRGLHGRGVCMAGCIYGRETCTCGVGGAEETATAADGMHPTGMHLVLFLDSNHSWVSVFKLNKKCCRNRNPKTREFAGKSTSFLQTGNNGNNASIGIRGFTT